MVHPLVVTLLVLCAGVVGWNLGQIRLIFLVRASIKADPVKAIESIRHHTRRQSP